MRIAHMAWESLHSIAVVGLAVHGHEITEAPAAGATRRPDRPEVVARVHHGVHDRLAK